MATGTVGGVFAGSELSSVGIVMASRAIFQSGAKINIFQAGLQCRGTMAIGTSYAAVSAKEREFRFRMIKPVKFVPSCGRMAGFASRHRSVWTLCFHAFTELPVMWIRVTSGAGTILKPVFHRRGRARGDRFVAICAQHRQMSTGQRKTGVLVARQRKARGLEALQIVTRLTSVLEGRIGELTLVNILMAVLTLCLRDLEKSVFALRALWQVTLVASDGHVATFE